MFAKIFVVALSAAAAAAWAQSDHAGHGTREGGRPAAVAWTTAPMLLPVGGRTERGQARLQPLNLTTNTVEVSSPVAGRETSAFAVADGVASIVPPDPKVGNYQWVVARESRQGERRLASTAWYVSNPGPAPTRMQAESRPGLNVVPRLPREHASYREGEKWDFAVRFDGQPVAGAVVKLETEFGTRTRAVAGEDGVATLVFPRDFDPARLAGGEHGGRSAARFVVSSEFNKGDIRYVSAFNSTYSPESGRSRNLLAGAGFLLLGMAAATPLLRRREEKQ